MPQRRAQHVGEALAHSGLVGEGDEGLEDVGGDEVLRQVDVEIADRAREAPDAIGIGGEPRAQIGGEALAQSREAGPGGGGGGINGRSHVPTVATRADGRGRDDERRGNR